MASSTLLTLDTTAPATVTIDVGSGTVSIRDLTANISTADGVTTGYSMKIYGDVDDAYDTANYRATEANAPWVSYSATKSVRLSATDGVKTVRIKVRDDVGNVSSEATDSVTLNTAIPVVSITAGLSATKISKVTSFDTATLTFQSDVPYDQFKVKVVSAASDADTAGVTIPTTAGSTTSGTGAAANTDKVVTIKGADLETASAGDGAKRIKVFVRATSNGLWSQGAS